MAEWDDESGEQDDPRDAEIERLRAENDRLRAAGGATLAYPTPAQVTAPWEGNAEATRLREAMLAENDAGKFAGLNRELTEAMRPEGPAAIPPPTAAQVGEVLAATDKESFYELGRKCGVVVDNGYRPAQGAW